MEWATVKTLRCILEELYAVELLEYHDKNLLSGDNKTRSEWKQKRIQDALHAILIVQVNTTIS